MNPQDLAREKHVLVCVCEALWRAVERGELELQVSPQLSQTATAHLQSLAHLFLQDEDGRRYTLVVRLIDDDLSGRTEGSGPSMGVLELRETTLPDEPVDMLLAQHGKEIFEALDGLPDEPLTQEEESDPAIVELRARLGPQAPSAQSHAPANTLPKAESF